MNLNPFTLHRARRQQLAFTMVEIALCLGVIGFALVAIIAVLPIGMQVQKDNREETIINQDATYLIEAIRGGARGLDELTNYVDGITNVVTVFNSAGGVITPATSFGYNRNTRFALLSGERIIGLLSTPKYQYFSSGAVQSNYVTAYLRSLSGSAVEKATNLDSRAFAFGYRVVPEIVPFNFYDRNETNYLAPGLPPAEVVARSNFWRYAINQQTNLYELRLLFRWPVLPNGNTGNGRQIFRTTVASRLMATNESRLFPTLYFFEPRNYVRVP